MKKPPMDLETHLAVANDIAIAAYHIDKAFEVCQKHFGKSSRVIQALWAIKPGNVNGKFTQVKGELDAEYHKIATDADFDAHGHIYYNLQERYEKLKKVEEA